MALQRNASVKTSLVSLFPEGEGKRSNSGTRSEFTVNLVSVMTSGRREGLLR